MDKSGETRQNKRVRGNGEDSLYYRKDTHRWVASVLLPDHIHRSTSHHKLKTDASQALVAMRKVLDEGRIPGGDKQSLAQYLAEWLEAVKLNLRPGTWSNYEQLVRIHVVPTLGSRRLSAINPQDLQRLYAQRRAAGLSAVSVKHLHACLHRAFSQAKRWRIIDRNPADDVDKPKGTPERRPTLNVEQVRALLIAARGFRLEALVVLAVTTGMREGELLGLHWEDIDFSRQTITVRQSMARQERGQGYALGAPKTASSRRTIRMGQVASDALHRRQTLQREERLRAGPAWKDTGLVFTRASARGGYGERLPSTHITDDILEPMLTAAGLPRVRFHDLRHAFATIGLRERIPAKVVSEALGHSRIGITLDLYTDVDVSLQGALSEAMDGLFGG